MSTLSNPVQRAGAIEGLLWIWLLVGTTVWLFFPPLRGHDPLFGWLPFWLVAAPLIDLGWLHRDRMLVVVRTLLVRRMHHRRPVRQARRLRRDQSLMPRRFFSMRRRNSDMMRRYRSSP